MGVGVSAFPPSVELTTLYEHVSARGTKYMLGRLGSARIVVLPGEPTEDGTRTWRVLLQERRESAAAPAIADGRPEPAPTPEHRQRAPRRRPRPHRELEMAAADRPLLDDSIADLWPDGGER